MKTILAVSLLVGFTSSVTEGSTPSRSYSLRLFERLAGVPLMLSDPRLAQVEKLVSEKKFGEAAGIATDDSNFYRVTVRDWAAQMSNREETTLVEFDDFQAYVIGVVRDRIDARQLLTGNFRYQGDPDFNLPLVAANNNNHYQQFEARRLNPKTDLVKMDGQWPNLRDAGGLLTTRAWARAHFVAGTNRRSVEFAFQEFLCAPIAKWRDVTVPDFRVRRDVERVPGGDAKLFQTHCRGCHGPMDAMGGAFARFDFVNEVFTFLDGFEVQPKMNANSTVYPPGYATGDSSWINLATENHNESFGWRGPLEGHDVTAFGWMLANSEAFSQCLTKRIFRKLCKKEPPLTTTELLAKSFESKQYDLRALFENVATHETCIERP